MPGTRTNSFPVRRDIPAYSNAAVTTNLILTEAVINYPCRIGAVKAFAETAGATGTAPTDSDTTLDLLRNGASVWSAAANRPKLNAASTGEFNNPQPDVRALQAGDRLQWKVASIANGTGAAGHARLMAAVTLEVA